MPQQLRVEENTRMKVEIDNLPCADKDQKILSICLLDSPKDSVAILCSEETRFHR